MKNFGERLKKGRQKFCDRNTKYFRGHPRTSLAPGIQQLLHATAYFYKRFAFSTLATYWCGSADGFANGIDPRKAFCSSCSYKSWHCLFRFHEPAFDDDRMT